MNAIPFPLLRPPGCFTSSDACELLAHYPKGRISHHRNEQGERYEVFSALGRPECGKLLLIWKDPRGRYYRGDPVACAIVAEGPALADVMPDARARQVLALAG
jgi:hypothetical protein